MHSAFLKEVERKIKMKMFKILVISLALCSMQNVAHADAIDDAIKARISFYQVAKHYFVPLAAMAKGDIEYNAEQAKLNAKIIETLSQMNTDSMWPEKSSKTDRPGQTRALAKIWSEYDAALVKLKDWKDTSTVLAKTAGNGLDELRKGLSAVNKACTACHDTYRAEKF